MRLHQIALQGFAQYLEPHQKKIYLLYQVDVRSPTARKSFLQWIFDPVQQQTQLNKFVCARLSRDYRQTKPTYLQPISNLLPD